MRSTILVVIFFISSGATIWGQENGDTTTLLEKANTAYAQFDNQAALKLYAEILEESPEHYEAMWRLARAHADVGKTLEDDPKRAYYLKADSIASRCISLYPDSAQAHFVKAIALGRRALFEGGKKKVELSKEIEIAAKRTIELNPNHGGAYHVLGRWNYGIATLNWFLKAAAKVIYGGLPNGTLEGAVDAFQKAIIAEPDLIIHRLELARTLIELDRYEDARNHLNKVLELKPKQWEDEKHAEEAKQMLKKIRKK